MFSPGTRLKSILSLTLIEKNFIDCLGQKGKVMCKAWGPSTVCTVNFWDPRTDSRIRPLSLVWLRHDLKICPGSPKMSSHWLKRVASYKLSLQLVNDLCKPVHASAWWNSPVQKLDRDCFWDRLGCRFEMEAAWNEKIIFVVFSRLLDCCCYLYSLGVLLWAHPLARYLFWIGK